MSRSSRDSATTGLGNSGYQSGGLRLRGGDQRPAGLGAFGDQFVEVVGLLGGELAHGEVVEDEHGGSDEFGEALGPGAVGVAAGEVGQGAAGLVEADLGALPDGEVAEGLGDVGLADADRAVQQDRLSTVEPAQCGEVADLGGGQFRAGGEVEPFEGGLLRRSGRGAVVGSWTWLRGGRSRPGRALAGSPGGPSSPAWAWVRRASRVSSMPDSFSARRLAMRAVSSTVTDVSRVVGQSKGWMLLWMSSGVEGVEVGEDGGVDLAGDVALEAADDLFLATCLAWCGVRRRRGCVGPSAVRQSTMR